MDEHTVVTFEADGTRAEVTFRGRWLVERRANGSWTDSVAITDAGEILVFTEFSPDATESFVEWHEDFATFAAGDDYELVEEARAAL